MGPRNGETRELQGPGGTTRRLVSFGHIERADEDAYVIGELYWRARNSAIDSARYAWECGGALAAKKESLPHGAWLRWLEENQETLGFETPRTAQRLIQLATDATLTSHLTEATATKALRELWGNGKTDAQLLNSSKDEEWYTPAKYIEAARGVLGAIDLNPASRLAANEIVQAAKFYSKQQDGLSLPWCGPGVAESTLSGLGQFFRLEARQGIRGRQRRSGDRVSEVTPHGCGMVSAALGLHVMLHGPPD